MSVPTRASKSVTPAPFKSCGQYSLKKNHTHPKKLWSAVAIAFTPICRI